MIPLPDPGSAALPAYFATGTYMFLQFLQSLAGPLVPSEALAAGASVLGLDLFSVVILGAVGVTVGDGVNYLVARRAGRAVLSRLIPRLVWKLEKMFRRHGTPALILIGVAPVGLSDLASYFAGMFNVDARLFLSITFFATVIRILLVTVLLSTLFS